MAREAFPFWRYSLRTYGQPAVAKACLALQDECGADVNLLLYCCWSGSEGRSLGPRAVRSAMTAVERWQNEVIGPLRRARRAINKHPRGSAAAAMKLLRRTIAAAELDAEYVEQRLLSAVAAGRSRPAGDSRPRDMAAANLARYFEALGAAPDPRALRRLRTLAEAVSPKAARLERKTR